MATRREDIIVSLGGDSKNLLKELNMSRQAGATWARQISQDLTQGHLPTAWKSYNSNVRAALREVDQAGKETAKNFGDRMVTSLKRTAGAALGLGLILKTIRMINQAFDETAAKIDKFNDKIDAAGYRDRKDRDDVSKISEDDQQKIVTAQFQKTGLLDMVKLKAAKAAAVATTSGLIFADFLKSGNMDKSTKRVLDEQKAIWEGMKSVQAEKDMAAAAQEKLDTEAKLAKLREDSNKISMDDLKKWREDNRLNTAIETYHLNEQLAARKKITDQIQLQSDIQARMNGLARQVGTNIMSEFMPGLDDLAREGIFTKDARRAQFLGGDIRRSLQFGNKKRAVDDAFELQSIRERLTKAGVFNDPNKALIDEFKALSDPIKSGKGLPVSVQLAK
jgi:hypothetical protein